MTLDCPYSARVLEKVSNGKGCWESLLVGIFKDGEQIGKYVRNYHSYGEATFYPFKAADGNWYALYSEDYAATSLMSLPSCQRIGGEDRHALGFCPVEYYIPAYFKASYGPRERDVEGIADSSYGCEGEYFEKQRETYERIGRLVSPEIHYLPFGFVAGCVWGDDNSWKIQIIDLRRAHEGIIFRNSEILGYCEMSGSDDLKKAVSIHDIDMSTENWENNVGIVVRAMSHYNVGLPVEEKK